MKRLTLGTLALAVLLVATLVACRAPGGGARPPSGSSSQPLVIGYMVHNAGFLTSFSANEEVAVDMALEDIHKQGDVNGYPIKLVKIDATTDPKQAIVVFRKLAEEEKVLAIMGPMFSNDFQVTAPLANELKIANPTAGAMTPGIAAVNRPWSFQLSASAPVLDPPAINGLLKLNPNVKKVAIVGNTTALGTAAAFKQVFPNALKAKGIEVVKAFPYETGLTDFSAIVTNLKGLPIDAILNASLSDASNIAFAKELERQSVKLPVVVSGIGVNATENMGTASESWIGGFWFDIEKPKAKDFLPRWYSGIEKKGLQAKPLLPGSDPNAYDLMMILANVMRQAKITPSTPLQEARTKIKDGLQNTKNYDGMLTSITITSTGDIDIKPVVVQRKAGSFTVIR